MDSKIWHTHCVQLEMFIQKIVNKRLAINLTLKYQTCIAQSTGAVEYTDCFSAEG